MKISDFFNGRLSELPSSGIPFEVGTWSLSGKSWYWIVDENGRHHTITDIAYDCLKNNKPFPKP